MMIRKKARRGGRLRQPYHGLVVVRLNGGGGATGTKIKSINQIFHNVVYGNREIQVNPNKQRQYVNSVLPRNQNRNQVKRLIHKAAQFVAIRRKENLNKGRPVQRTSHEKALETYKIITNMFSTPPVVISPKYRVYLLNARENLKYIPTNNARVRGNKTNELLSLPNWNRNHPVR